MHISPWFLVPMAILALLGLSRLAAYIAYRCRRIPVDAAFCECRVCGNLSMHVIQEGLPFEDLECVKCESPTCDIIDGEEVMGGYA